MMGIEQRAQAIGGGCASWLAVATVASPVITLINESGGYCWCCQVKGKGQSRQGR